VDRIINIPLLKHPVNWLIVWLVLLFAGFAWHLLHDAIQGSASSAQVDSQNSQPFNANG
jgi:hypothetical protein